jgi:hypothetical protein
MARSLNIVIGADIEKLRKGLQDAITAIQSSGNKMSAETAKAASAIENKLAEISKKNPTAGTVRQLTNLAMEARALGPEFAQTANDIIIAAGKMKDAIGDTRAEVSYFASDTRKLDAVLGGVQGIAGAFGAVEGAMALAGVQSEDFQKTMLKLQGAMAVVNGLQAVSALLLDENATRTGAVILLNELRTATSAKLATALAAETVAQRAANVAIMAAPYALAIGAVVALGVAIANYTNKADKASAVQKNFNAINEETQKNFEQEVKNVSALLAVVNNHNASMAERKKALAEIQTIYPSFLANQNLDKVNSTELKTATQGLTNEILKQARAKAAYNKLQELSAKLIDIDLGRQQAQITQQAELNKLYAAGADPSQIQGFLQSQKGLASIAEKNAQNLQQQIDAIIKMATAENLAITPTTKETTALTQQSTAVKALTDNVKALNTTNAKTPQLGASSPTIEAFAKATGPLTQYPQVIKQSTDEQIKIVTEYEQNMALAMEGVNQAFNNLTAEGLESFGELIGGLMTGQIDSVDQFGKAMLQSVAKFMRAFGSALVATATASKAFKELILKNPLAAAAAGVALIAGSAIITGMLNKGPQPTAFAEGGIVSGPTLGLVGEYPNARTNPEVIAPLDKLKGMLKTNEQSGYIASTSINGRDLAIVLERYNKDSKRG